MKKPVICFLFSSCLMQSARPRSSPGGTRITTFLIVQCSYRHIWVFASFQFSLFCLTIFLVDGLKIKMVAGRCRATAGRRHVDRKCAVVAQVKGGHTNASLNSLLASSPFWNSPFGILLFQISHSYVSHWVFSELWGGGYESLRMEITIVEPKGLLFDPPLNHHTKVSWLHFILVQCFWWKFSP